MITVRNRTLIVPEGERVIGTDYDNNSEVRQFRVEKAPGGIDISHLAFRLDLMYQGEIYDTCKLEKEEREDSMILAWTVAATNVAHPGTVWISLRAIDDAGTVKWGSNAAALYVQFSVNTPSHASGMTELEEHEKKMEDLLLKSEEAVSRANNATSKAETAIQTTTEAVKTAQTAATSAGSSADLAEAWAHGKKGYTAQTNDNAMYWSEQSKKRAESAKEQADLAKIYADSIAPLMDRGEYSSGTTYQENDLVKYQNAIWRCKIDGTASVPQEGENWTLFFRGVQSINELVAADAQGLLGQAGAQQVNAQALIDAVAEKIATKLLLKSDVVSQLVNDVTKAASSAAVYALQQKLGTGDLPNGMSDVVAGLTALNSDFFNRIDATKISLLTQPSGTTIRQKIENCQKGTLCSWAHNPSELYNPTGKNGTWSFLIVRADKEMYTICLACEGGSKLYIYSYNANAWYGMDGTVVRQFN